jgi:FkbM family methyltransferase
MSLTKKLKKIALRDYLTSHPRTYRRFGAVWLLRYRNYIDRKLILGERYEDDQIKYCARIIAESGVSCFVDIGANCGLYSITLATGAASLDSFYAFEPDPRNYNHLCANIFLNGFDSLIDARRIGLSNAKGSVRFLCNKGNSTGMSRVADTAPGSTNAGLFDESLIEVDTLDSQLGAVHDKVVYLKIDVEGHEKSVIEGGRSFFQQNRCFLQIEILGDQASMIDWIREEIGLSCMRHIGNDHFFEKDSKVTRVSKQQAPTC